MSIKPLIRISTAGSVDDGKSTLIGRLMHDCHAILEDQLLQIKSKQNPNEVDLASFTDGLKSEREQGITIDVAYKYFSTPNRKYILADTPGHVQYTRNMATGASNADVAIILVDCMEGVTEQTTRHSKISALLGIPNLIFAVNKIDRCDYDEATFRRIEGDIKSLTHKIGIKEWLTIPISALKGDQVTTKSDRLAWFDGPSLLEILEGIDTSRQNQASFRFSVQLVIRPHQDFRGFAGRLASGQLSVGDAVHIYPSQRNTKVKSILRGGELLNTAYAGQSLVIELADEVDCDRGSILSDPKDDMEFSKNWQAELVWFDEKPSSVNRRYLLKYRERIIPSVVSKHLGIYDLNSLKLSETDRLNLNDIGTVHIEANLPIAADPYDRSRFTGSFILIDPETNSTAGAGFFTKSLQQSHVRLTPVFWYYSKDPSYLARIQRQNQHRSILLLDGESKEFKERDIWWLQQIAESQISVLTNIDSYKEFSHDQIKWSISQTEGTIQESEELPYETGL